MERNTSNKVLCMLKDLLEIYHFYAFQGYKLQCAIENIDVHLILTKDI
jgi:hypothetical protein